MKRLIVITGPTASGKSALAVDMARRLNTEIISADSRQVYRGMPIVTAVPTEEERGGVRHHLLECLDLREEYSAARFASDAMRIARRLWDEGREDVVVCGGSMMYVDALCFGIDELPDVPAELRAALKAEWEAEGDAWLLSRLKELDPDYYGKVDRANLKRVFHAVEISLTAGRPYSSLLTGSRPAPSAAHPSSFLLRPASAGRNAAEADRPEIIRMMIDLPREEHFARINARVGRMMQAGLEEEARRLYPMRGLNSLNTVGLKEMFAWFDGAMTREEALSRMAKNTRVYAKKQLTWFKRDPHILRIAPGSRLPI